MSAFSKSKKILLGLGAITGVSALYYLNNERNKVHASWTTSYEPTTNSIWDDNWDHRSPKVLHKRHVAMKLISERDENELNEAKEKYGKPTANRHIILIRHGQYNLNGITDNERILTKLGRIQAEFTGKRLKELNLPYTDMVKSTMSRAQETGSIISAHLPDIPVTHCDLLREGAPIPPEPPVGHYRPEVFKFFQDGARIEAAFRKYFHRADPKQEKDSFTILVCHANVIRYFVCRALQFPAEAWLRFSLNHASITHVIITPSGRCILRTFGDSGFMPPDVITSH